MQINSELKKIIDESYNKIKDEFNTGNSRINHLNIYHKDWIHNSHNDIINILYKIYNIDPKSIISFGWINGQVNCQDQHFHIDYNGNTHTYFIPIVELNNKNGTEYVKFNNKQFNIDLIDKLKIMSDKYITQQQIITHFTELEINQESYKFCILNTPAYSMVLMPNYIYHRGKKNETLINKIMFQIVIGTYDGANISSNV